MFLCDAKWIKSPAETREGCHEFYRQVKTTDKVKRATLTASSIGIYSAYINGKKVGNDLFTPGWTEYRKQIQYQTYDVTDMLKEENELSFTVAEGWAVGYIGYGNTHHTFFDHISLIFELEIEYDSGKVETIVSDEQVKVRSSIVTMSQIYNGETIDMTAPITEFGNALADEVNTTLVPQINETVREQEHIAPVKLIVTPSGEKVIDFGQNMAGYVVIKTHGKKGDRVVISHAEVLDKDGNFYTDNLRAAKQLDTYVLGGGEEVFKPRFTWQGFRYIRLDEYPYDVDLADFEAVAVHSDIKRTGHFFCGNKDINQLYHNIIWGQKSNYVDVPTDCPQRDERLGWTGDALAFMRTAAINYDVEDFFKKWLGDVALTQHEDGGVPGIVPEPISTNVSAAWGDAATHCPWEVYLAYGNKEILATQFDSMKKWVEYMHNFGEEEFLWVGGQHYGDWLNLDGGKGYENIDFQANDYIASVFFAYSTSLLIKAGEVLGKDMSEYKALYDNVVNAIRARYFRDGVPALRTQTAFALAICFDLCEEEYKEKCAATMVALIEESDRLLTTGFVGTPKLLHALTKIGRNDLAYDLLLTDRFPSWLFSVKQGATTMWEHWDCIKEDGTFWSAGMNSFNHYAYGAVYDWMFGVGAGIKVCEDGPGYTHITIEPVTDPRLGYLRAGIDSRAGKIESHWYYKGDEIYFEFTVPEKTVADITLPDGRKDTVSGGKYIYTVVNG